MKKTFVIAGLLIVFGAGAVWAQEAAPLEGAWERMFVRVILPDTTIEEHFPSPPRLQKILTTTRFAFGRQTDDGEDVFAGGGKYTLSDSAYVETYAYHGNPSMVGKSVTFDSSMEDDSLWHISGVIGRFRLEETWRRLE